MADLCADLAREGRWVMPEWLSLLLLMAIFASPLLLLLVDRHHGKGD